MNKIDIENLLIKTHENYVKEWLIIDIAAGSIMAPMSYDRFCEKLLIFDDIFWARWSLYAGASEKVDIKSYILDKIKRKYFENTNK